MNRAALKARRKRWLAEMNRRVSPRIPLMNKKLCVVILVVPILLLAACGGERQALGGRATDGPKEGRGGKAETRTEETGTAAGDAQRDAKDGAAHRGGAAGGDRIGKVTLEISGNPGTGFSGACVLGEQRKELDGQVPERFVYELDGRQLRCRIRTQDTDGATLKAVLTAAGDAHYIQQTGTGGATMSFVYSESGFSSSTVSSAGATSTSSSSSSVSSYSSSEGDR